MNLPDGDYTLSEGAAWVDVKGFTIRIHRTDEGVVVDIFNAKTALTGDFDAALVSSTYAFDHELEVSDENI